MLNKVQLIGILGKDPELKNAKGTPCARFSLATNEYYINASGHRDKRTTWHNMVIFGNRASALAQYMKKGHKGYFEGRINNREWEDRGVKKYFTDIDKTSRM